MVDLVSVYSSDPNVTNSHLIFLYRMLKERDPRTCISHEEMPTYKQHIDFVMNKPYKEWFIIYNRDVKVGNIYITKMNEIGLFICDAVTREGFGSKALKMLIRRYKKETLLANIAPKNERSQAFFTKHGFVFSDVQSDVKQYTYVKCPAIARSFS
jgi:RimJ/RimL family protein N-acetyltransferase